MSEYTTCISMRVAIVTRSDLYPKDELQRQWKRVAQYLSWCGVQGGLFIQAMRDRTNGNPSLITEAVYFLADEWSAIHVWLGNAEWRLCVTIGLGKVPSLDPGIVISRKEFTVNDICLGIGEQMKRVSNAFLIAVMIKPSRREEFAERKFFHLIPGPVARPKSIEILKQKEATTSSHARNALIVPLAVEEPVTAEALTFIDGALFKASDFLIAAVDEKHAYSPEFSELLNRIHSSTSIQIIDTLGSINKILDRSVFPSLLPSSVPFPVTRFPNQFTLHKPSPIDQIAKKLGESGICDELLLDSESKGFYYRDVSTGHHQTLESVWDPVVASHGVGRDASHVDHSNVEYPLCIQQFHVHGDYLWKIYVAGTHVFVEKETSISRILDEMTGATIEFNALKEKRIVGDSFPRDGSDQIDCDIVVGIAKELRKGCGLALFGFDLIVDACSGEYLIVDVNHFPSMKRVKRWSEAMHETMHDVIHRKSDH